MTRRSPGDVGRQVLSLLFTPGPSPAVYVLRMWPLQIVPDVLLAVVIYGVVALLGHPLTPQTTPAAGFFLIVILAPALETLIMVPIFWLLRRVTSNRLAVVVLSAVIWAALHASGSPIWGMGVLWGFFVLSAAFVAWRQRSPGAAYGVTFALHALNNLTAWFVCVRERLGGDRAALLALVLVAVLMCAGLWAAQALAARGRPDEAAASRLPAVTVVRSGGEPVPLSVNAARASWVCPILGFGVATWLKHYTVDDTMPEMAALLVAPLVGFLLGLVALVGMFRHGSRRILAPALMGMLISSVLLLVWLVGVLRRVAPEPLASGRP